MSHTRGRQARLMQKKYVHALALPLLVKIISRGRELVAHYIASFDHVLETFSQSIDRGCLGVFYIGLT